MYILIIMHTKLYILTVVLVSNRVVRRKSKTSFKCNTLKKKCKCHNAITWLKFINIHYYYKFVCYKIIKNNVKEYCNIYIIISNNTTLIIWSDRLAESYLLWIAKKDLIWKNHPLQKNIHKQNPQNKQFSR